ncbi:1-acyl-sn-glycerol-3-phosphate acyltransferase [Persicobacter psychrovividus]|uniref:Glycerol acyltransferase n=1 Tax=Persicobacter psychrovividus TaxID=387638 RepID=A0ABN6LG27_9BACT|nr:glycerol acyltransferase [Persicobacter psychrovividus]
MDKILTFMGKKKGWVLGFIFLILTFSAYRLTVINFHEDITEMLPFDKGDHQIIDALKHAKILDKFILVIDQDSSNLFNNTQLTQGGVFFDALLEDSTINNQLIGKQSHITGNEMDHLMSFVYQHLPVFLSDEDFQELESKSKPDSVRQVIRRGYKTLISPAGLVSKKYFLKDPFSLGLTALAKFKSLKPDDQITLENGFLTSKDKSKIFFILTPNFEASDNAKAERFLALINEKITLAKEKYPHLRIRYFGTLPVAYQNAKRIKTDVMVTCSLALTALFVLIGFLFRKWYSLFLVILPPTMGALTAIGVLSLFEQNISAISLGAGSLILGITIDFSLHFLSHYFFIGNRRKTLKEIFIPLLVSSLTTTTAFFCLFFVKSKAMQDLGMFAGVSVFSSAIYTLLILPLLVKDKKATIGINFPQWLLKNIEYAFHESKVWKMVICGLTVVAVLFYKTPTFDHDLSNMNYMTEDLKSVEADLNQMSNLVSKSVYVVSEGKDFEEALQHADGFREKLSSAIPKNTKITHISLTSVVPPLAEQRQRIARWEKFWLSNGPAIRSQIIETASDLGFRHQAFAKFDQILEKKYQVIGSQELKHTPGFTFSDFFAQGKEATYVYDLLKTKDLDAVKSITDHCPSSFVLNRSSLTSKMVTMLKDDFSNLLYYSSVAVFLILLVFYGRVELALITIIPMMVSWLWTIGLMNLFGINFNIFNIIIISFIFGLGIDYGVFLTNGLMTDRKNGTNNFKAFKHSIFLSAVTTLFGIGVLLFAEHPALKSIAWASIIGITTVLLLTYSILPILFHWLVGTGKYSRKLPYKLSDMLMSLLTGTVFILGSILLSLLTLILMIPIGPKPKRQKLFHWCIQKAMLVARYSLLHVPFKLHPYHKSLFDKPAVWIANHHSMLDLIFLLSISPKFIVVVKEWVVNNPLFGMVVRFADFIPVHQGYDEVKPMIDRKILEGYSILVFPEGSRNRGQKLSRFKQGAFVMARELGLPVGAIVTRGFGAAHPKGQTCAVAARMDMQIFLPVAPTAMGQTPRDQGKNWRKFYNEKNSQLAQLPEIVKNEAMLITQHFLYTPPIVYWYVKVKLQLENNYLDWMKYIPQTATISDLGCGYGYTAGLLKRLSAERAVYAYDYDQEKIKYAQNCLGNHLDIEFDCVDLVELSPKYSDVIIIKDVLHYLTTDQQSKLLGRCIKALKENGKLLIREGNATKEQSHKKTEQSERWSSRIGFNKRKQPFHFIDQNFMMNFARHYGKQIEVVPQSEKTSNTLYIIY